MNHRHSPSHFQEDITEADWPTDGKWTIVSESPPILRESGNTFASNMNTKDCQPTASVSSLVSDYVTYRRRRKPPASWCSGFVNMSKRKTISLVKVSCSGSCYLFNNHRQLCVNYVVFFSLLTLSPRECSLEAEERLCVDRQLPITFAMRSQTSSLKDKLYHMSLSTHRENE